MMKRGRDFFIMFLARELRMTRRNLLASMDSYELTMWQAFLKAESIPAEKRQSKEEIENKIKTAFMVTQHKKNMQRIDNARHPI